MADQTEQAEDTSAVVVPPEEAADQEEIELELPPAGLLPEGVLADVEINPEGLSIKFLNVPGSSSIAVAMYALLGMQNLREVFHDDLENASVSVPGASGATAADGAEELVLEEGEDGDESEETEDAEEEVVEPTCAADSVLICKTDANRHVVRLKRPKKSEPVAERRRMGFNTDTP